MSTDRDTCGRTRRLVVTSDRGIALVVTTMAVVLLGGLAAALVVTTTAEAQIAAHFRIGQEALYAADAAAEWALAELAAAPDWSAVVEGRAPSSFVDGVPRGRRVLEDGSRVDLDVLVAASAGWRLYAYGGLNGLVPPSGKPSPFYVLVFVAPDGFDPDRVNVRAEAFGPRGARRMLVLSLSRRDEDARIESWMEVR